MIQKRKNIKTLGNLITTRSYKSDVSCFDALSFTYYVSPTYARTLDFIIFTTDLGTRENVIDGEP
jgi:hypothetical protein